MQSAATLSRTRGPTSLLHAVPAELGSFPIFVLNMLPIQMEALCFLLGVGVRGDHVATCCHSACLLQLPAWATAHGDRERAVKGHEKWG